MQFYSLTQCLSLLSWEEEREGIDSRKSVSATGQQSSNQAALGQRKNCGVKISTYLYAVRKGSPHRVCREQHNYTVSPDLLNPGGWSCSSERFTYARKSWSVSESLITDVMLSSVPLSNLMRCTVVHKTFRRAFICICSIGVTNVFISCGKCVILVGLQVSQCTQTASSEQAMRVTNMFIR